MSPPLPSIQPRRILVRGVNWLGDAVMSTPALLRLRERFPGSHIAVLTPEKLRDLWPGHPAIDSVHTFDRGESPWRIGRRLRGERFDLALVLPNSPRSALEAWFSGAKRRVGYARSWRSLFLTDAIPSRPDEVAMHKLSTEEVHRRIASTSSGLPEIYSAKAHHSLQYLHLVAALGGNAAPLPPKLEVSENELQRARELLPKAPAVWVGINAGAEYGPAKRWPQERFIAAARMIYAKTGCGFLLFGGQADIPLASALESGLRHPASGSTAVNLAGQTSLRQLCALMKLCRVVLTNDTGPMHVASAVGTPVVVPFGSTSPELTGPGLPGDPRHALLKSGAPCSPCFLRECPIDFRCMNGITPESVAEAVVKRV
jgi:heptosyltransferase II